MAIIKELDAVKADVLAWTQSDQETIKRVFHDEVVNQLKSLVSRAENMELTMKRYKLREVA
jgi:hypothetical protein